MMESFAFGRGMLILDCQIARKEMVVLHGATHSVLFRNNAASAIETVRLHESNSSKLSLRP